MATPTTNHNPIQWTDRQGQYLAFIYAYTTIHRQAPAERDIQHFFRATPPSVHNMLHTLEQRGFIRRQPGMARSIQLLVPSEQLPILKQVE
jgi:Mn-dependent DtxR family transcriptional regulator